MKMIELIVAGTLAFCFALLFFRFWCGISDMHAVALRRLEAVTDASILVAEFREQTEDGSPPVFPAQLPSGLRGISGVGQSETVDSRGGRRFTLVFTLLGRKCEVRTGGGE